MLLSLVLNAHATSLQEVVDRAAEVNPAGIFAELEWRQKRVEAAEAWSARSVTPEISYSRTWVGATPVDDDQVQVSLALVDVAGWLDAMEQGAQARALRGVADATVLDAQYAAAVLYFEALAAQRAADLGARSLAEAESTLDVTRARVEAGMEPALYGQAAEARAVRARATHALAVARLDNARARLARAIEGEVGVLEEAPVPEPPTVGTRSPWVSAADAAIGAARLEQAEGWAELLPTAELRAEASVGGSDWIVGLRGTWTIDGIGPVLRARWAELERRKAIVYRDGLRRDLDLAAATGTTEARALAAMVEAARAEEALAQAALDAGQASLAVGLVDALDVIRLQDDLLDARQDRVDAELEQAYAVLEARRVAGEPW